jgi:acyl-CoA reductase-like NAD-dependent aldehyde dehydrogenase
MWTGVCRSSTSRSSSRSSLLGTPRVPGSKSDRAFHFRTSLSRSADPYLTCPRSRTEYRPLEGFVLAVTPFNFTAIGGNLVFAPAIMGNVCIWKPSPAAVYANFLTHKIMLEAGLPPSVIQFTPVSVGVGPWRPDMNW